MKIFLSYHHTDEVFAKGFTTWLKTFSKLQVFSTSHPMSVKPGQWFSEIVDAASCAGMIFLLIGPDSIDYRWMLFEAGITAGNDHDVVPLIFGGVTVDDLKMPLKHYQIYRLDDKERFNALFGTERLLDDRNMDFYASFLEHDPMNKLYLKYGSFSRFYTDRIHDTSEIDSEGPAEYELTNIGDIINPEDKKDNRQKSPKHDILIYPLINENRKSLVSVRLSVRPLRCEGEDTATWKAGISFDREPIYGGVEHLFSLHSGNHRGLSSWTLYPQEKQPPYAINIPAIMAFEATHSINIWINQNRNELLSYGIDSDRNRYVFTINGRERTWNPKLLEAKSMQIGAWIDGPEVQQFRVKIICELDYC
jgi:hypothetical protein